MWREVSGGGSVLRVWASPMMAGRFLGVIVLTTQPQGTSSPVPSPFTDPDADQRPAASRVAGTGARTGAPGPGGRGTTTIVDTVIAKLAGIAIADIPGVYALGGGAARALGSIRGAVGQKDLTQGVSVEVGQTQVAVDLTIVAEYPHPLQDVAEAARDAVYRAVEDLAGMEVTEVNVTITDIHIPSEDEDLGEGSAPTTREGRVS